MEIYEGDIETAVPEIRYDMAGYTTYSGPEQSSLDVGYTDYDWSRLNPDPNRQVYPIPENMDPQCQTYLGYPGMGQTDLMSSSPYLQQPSTEVTYSSPLRQLGFGCSDSLYGQSQTYSSVSPTGSSSSTSSGGSSGSTPGQKPKRKRVQSAPQRKAANIRERRRMFHLNEAFDELRKRLPAFNYEKRLSRIETLRLAMTYIGFMKNVSDGQDPKEVKLISAKGSEDQDIIEHKENVISNEI